MCMENPAFLLAVCGLVAKMGSKLWPDYVAFLLMKVYVNGLKCAIFAEGLFGYMPE